MMLSQRLLVCCAIQSVFGIELVPAYHPENCPSPFEPCPGICCLEDNAYDPSENKEDPYIPVCTLRAFWITYKDGTISLYLPLFTFTMGGTTSTETAGTKKVEEDASIDDRETNSGLTIFDVHVNCAGGTLLMLFLVTAAAVLVYLGYRRFCKKGDKKKKRECDSESGVHRRQVPDRWEEEAASDMFISAMKRHQVPAMFDDDYGYAPVHRPLVHGRRRAAYFPQQRFVELPDPVIQAAPQQQLAMAPLAVAPQAPQAPPAVLPNPLNLGGP